MLKTMNRVGKDSGAENRDRLADIFGLIRDVAFDMLADSGYLLPTFTGFPEDPSKALIIIEAPDRPNPAHVREIMRRNDCTIFAHVCETWFSEQAAREHRMPSECADRIDGMVVMVASADRCLLQSYRVDKVDGKRVASPFGELSDSKKGDTVGGIWPTLLAQESDDKTDGIMGENGYMREQ